MNRLLVSMLRMPMELLVMGMDLLLKGLREIQAVLDEAADGVKTDTPGTADFPAGFPDWRTRAGPGWDAWDVDMNNPFLHPKETRAMTGIDLGGDDAKNVSYWITFVKPDFVATLQDQESETIDYPTDEGSFGGLKIARFFERLQGKKVEWPDEWSRAPSTGYTKEGDKLTTIPRKDERYIKFNLRLNWRQPLPDAERDKDKVEVLRDIREELRKINE